MTKTLGEVFRDLSFGHLANLSIGEEGTGEIMPDKQLRVLSMVNAGLKMIYSRFLISQKELILRPIEGRSYYPLYTKHADSSSDLDPKFIADSVDDPFTGDVLRVLLVRDHEGRELRLNDYDVKPRILTDLLDTVRITELDDQEPLHIEYQANHPRLETPEASQLVHLPDVLHGALDAYVGYRIIGAMNGQEHQLKAAELMASYEGICGLAQDKDFGKNALGSTNTKLEDRGFV